MPIVPGSRRRAALRCVHALAGLFVSGVVAPLAAQGASADELLKGWLAVRSTEGQFDEFMAYRAAVEKVDRQATACAADLDAKMRQFEAAQTPTLPDAAVDKLLAELRARRERFVSGHGLLPWLLLVAKGCPDDVRVMLCVAEAWATAPDGIRDPVAARAAFTRLRAVVADEAAGGDASTKLTKFAGELAGFDKPEDTIGWLPSRIDAAAEVLDQQGALPAGWLIDQRVGNLEREFAAAVRGEGKRSVLEVIEAMAQVSPNDPTCQLLYALVASSAGYEGKSPDTRLKRFRDAWGKLPTTGGITRASVENRLERLGVFAAARRVGVDEGNPEQLAAAVKKQSKNGLFPTGESMKGKLRTAQSILDSWRSQLEDWRQDERRLVEKRKGLGEKLKRARGQEARDARQNLDDCDRDIRQKRRDIAKKDQDIRDKKAEIDALGAEIERVQKFSLGS